MIDIQSNGSRWAGEEPATIEELLEVLATEPLDPSFERYGNFVLDDDPAIPRFWGNFANLSHVFSIDTDEPALIEPLTTAIRANQQTPAYQQAKRELVASAEAAARREQELEKLRAAKAIAHARKVLEAYGAERR